ASTPSSAKCPTDRWKRHRTSNIQHRTPNVEVCPEFGARCAEWKGANRGRRTRTSTKVLSPRGGRLRVRWPSAPSCSKLFLSRSYTCFAESLFPFRGNLDVQRSTLDVQCSAVGAR